MSRHQAKYARKAQRYVVKNPEASASDFQRKQVRWLLAHREHTPAFEASVLSMIDLVDYTRGMADQDIKRLAGAKAIQASHRPNRKVEPKKVVDEALDFEALAKSGKLGKVAQKRAMALTH